ncbi:MAG: tRNA dimethylallyltransferase [Frankiales bacterium]|nr:tRNA dimethylallyltransferase [Frankiales bacterium]
MARVVAVVGPTATGKSELGIALAREVGGEVVNADSMQLYRGMDVGTAKLTEVERAGIPHHLLDVWDVTHTATAAEYQQLARSVIDELLAREVTPVLVGGSGLYLRAALDELSFPATDPELRATLEAELEQNGALALHARLAALDAAAAARMQPSNGRRVVRALEVVLLTGGMPGEMTSYDGHYTVTYVGLDREDLATRTDARVDRMWAAGLVDEVRKLEQLGLRKGVTASRALGYAQVLSMLDGTVDEPAAIEATKVATRRFVRRQRAWFRRDPRISWLDPDGDLLGQGMTVLTSK